MKKIVFLTAAFFVAVFFIACSNNNSKNSDNTGSTATTNAADGNKLYACPMHPEVTGKKGEKCSKCGMELTKEVSATVTSPVTENTATDPSDKQTTAPATQSKFSISDIVSNYLKLKNALTKDDANGAATSGKALYTAFANANTASLDENQKKEFADIADDAKEHGEHIGANGGKIDHQREHFALLSKDINDLIKMFGAPQKLYQDFCPMYDDGKGAIWISETQEIKNPFFGSKMPTCGSVKRHTNETVAKKIALTLLICFVLLQFYQPARNKSNGQDLSKDFVTTYNAPDSIKKILHTSCYDCHSNNTNYLWYDYIQPARMLVESHIKRGKRELNFNEWTDYSTRKQGSKLKGIIKQVQEGEMPLKSYTMLHTSAKLNAAEREQLINWLNTLVNRDNKSN